MSKLLVFAIAGVTPFVAPVPASLSTLLGPAYLVVFGVALFMAGRAMRRPSENPSAQTEKNSWPSTVPQSSTVAPM